MRGSVLAVTVMAAVGLTGSAASAGTVPETWQQPTAATYTSTTLADVQIPMRDGVSLVGDVIYPADKATGQRAQGKFPVVLVQNPYFCDTSRQNLEFVGSSTAGTTFYAERGYIYAAFCVRGTGRSGGEFDRWSEDQRKDGVELVRWAKEGLAGSNGIIGLAGCSYLGMIQLFTAGLLPPDSGVKAIIPLCAGAEAYREAGMPGGMPADSTISGTKGVAGLMGPRAAAWGAGKWAEIERGGPLAYDGEYTRYRSPGNWAEQIVKAGIPVLLWSGYQDMFGLGAHEMYAYLQNAYHHRPVHAPMVPGQRTTPRYQIIMGPWGHGGGKDSTIMISWLNTWLKGQRTGMDVTSTPMHIYQQGSGKWVNTATVPMLRESTPYYLGNAGTLTPAKPRTRDADSIAYTQPRESNGTLTYTTAPFARGATIAGPISASITASSTGSNLHLIGTLADVAPDGTATTLTSGSLVGSLREVDKRRSWYDRNGNNIRPYNTFTRDQYLTPGQDYQLEFQMLSRIAEVAPGHALRLTITTQTPTDVCGASTSSTAPCYPTTPQQRTLPGTYKVQLGASKINLPLAPYGCFPASGGTGPEPASFRGPARSCT